MNLENMNTKIAYIFLILTLSLIVPIVTIKLGVNAIFLTLFLLIFSSLSFLHMKNNKTLIYTWIFFLGFPFFVNVGGSGIVGLGRSVFASEPGQTVPLSLFIMAWVLLLMTIQFLASHKKIIINDHIKKYTVIIFLCGIVSLFGLFFDEHVSNISYIFQIFSPFLAYIIAINFIKDKQDYVKSIKVAIFGGIAGILALLVSNISRSGIGLLFSGSAITDKSFFYFVYQIYDYYPVALSIIAVLLLSYIPFAKNMAMKISLGFITVLCVLSVMKLNSRNAFLLLALSIFLLFIFSKVRLPIKLLSFFICTIAIYAAYFVQLPVFSRFSSDVNSISTRSERLSDGLQFVFQHPFLGAMFRSNLITGYHNQYLEIAGNGGLFIVVLFVLFLIQFVVRTIKYIRLENDKQIVSISKSIVIVVVSVLLVSNIAQSNFTQPYTAFILWFIIGCQDAIARISNCNKPS